MIDSAEDQPVRPLPITARAAVAITAWLVVVAVAALWPFAQWLLNRAAG